MRGEPENSNPLADLLALSEAAEKYEEAKSELVRLSSSARLVFQYVRTTNHITQEDLATALSRSQTYVSQVESGKRTPSADSLSAFANSTQVQEAMTSGEDSNGTDGVSSKEEQDQEVPSQ